MKIATRIMITLRMISLVVQWLQSAAMKQLNPMKGR